ncbi:MULTISPECIES: MGMT family protein [Nocardia]|jgi:alkylated DNA nucleotide flippase Atl1|uniref:6-O-methylguanine DNA methyltransferase n=2 Tax=Nocardia TaxID=1817 RepID=A0A2T2Z744_9NOCA|nr:MULTISPECIES: MGMT family protein [Nocardia]MBF6448313.1 MGMT family protein [Nocardia elegans]PSR63584.1 6-O-methylguanine DNA methyltransferase [Nocardia nova]
MSRVGSGAISPFARRVLDVIDQIPPGRVMSYGAIGDLVGAGPRQVGRVMTAWSDETLWHRVVRADGTPASCHAGSAVELLRAEGTPMRGSRVDMSCAQWNGPPDHPGMDG